MPGLAVPREGAEGVQAGSAQGSYKKVSRLAVSRGAAEGVQAGSAQGRCRGCLRVTITSPGCTQKASAMLLLGTQGLQLDWEILGGTCCQENYSRTVSPTVFCSKHSPAFWGSHRGSELHRA